MKTMQLTNKTGATLRICIEPIPHHYDLGVEETAEVVGFDPERDVLDVIIQTDPSGVSITIDSFRENIGVFVAGRRLTVVPD